MATNRMMPPANAAQGPNPIYVPGGRSYSCAVGGTIDVPDFDAAVMAGNGWTHCAAGGTGPTSARPVNPKRGTTYNDTTLGYLIVWEGVNWRNAVTGAAV